MIERPVSLSLVFAIWALTQTVAGAQTKAGTEVMTKLSELESEVRALRNEVIRLSDLLKSLMSPAPVLDIDPVDIEIADLPRKGSPKARVAVIEFSDFECPFCGRHAASTLKDIQRVYVDTGKVQYIFRHLPLVQLHPSARRVAEVAACAHEQKKFWGFHDQAFANQKALRQPDLIRYAEAEGLDVSELDSCIASGRAKSMVENDLALASKLDLTGTPSFLIGLLQANGTVQATKKIVGGHPFPVFQATLDNFYRDLR
jgi:protein-disulfide isomerase